MGVSFNVGESSWSYGGFDIFRHRLAKTIGFPLDQMEGFGGTIPWDQNHPDPITLLLQQPDNDGTLLPIECQKIAPRLREIVDSWSGDSENQERYEYDKKHGLLLADAMDTCVHKQISLEFG